MTSKIVSKSSMNRTIKKGDVVMIHMPHTVKALISMHVSARARCAPDELAKRIIDYKPKIITGSSAGKRNDTCVAPKTNWGVI